MLIRSIFVSLILGGLAPLAQADDPAAFDAQHFVDTKCTACHDSTVYTRENRRVDSLPRLESQVRRCDANLGTQLFDDDLLSVVDHLNEAYYQFEE